MPMKRPRSTAVVYSRKARRVIRKGRYRRPKLNTKILLRVARNQVLKASETKKVSYSAQNIALYHNDPTSVINNLLATSPGDNDNQRNGDEIWPKGLSLKIWLSNKSDRPNVSYRVILYTCDANVVGTNAIPANFWAGTASTNYMLEYINTDKCSVVKQWLLNPMGGDYSLESGATNKEHSRYLTTYIPLTKRGKLKYQTDGGNKPKYQKHCFMLAVVAYDAYGTLGSDNIATISYIYRMYYKDP